MKSTLMPLLMLEFALAAAAQEAAAPIHPSRLHGADRFDDLILDCSQTARLNPRFVKALIATESDFAPDSISATGAVGLMQVMPDTALALGVDPDALGRPETNLRAGTAFLNDLFRSARKRYGLKAMRLSQAPLWVQRRVLAAYNAGPRMLYRTQWPPQTRRYVQKIMRLRKESKTTLRIPNDANRIAGT